ncbi:MAG: exodeoxyribonuclease V subunit gamma, partial [Microthrixaceae bacterium]
PSPPERMSSVLPKLNAGEMEIDLPARVCVFGMSLLPGGPGFMDLAEALGVGREVHLFVVESSPVLTSRFAAGRQVRADTVPQTGHRLRRALDPTALHHPLLRSWGRVHYETASVLEDARAAGRISISADHGGQDARHSGSTPSAPETLLGLLQQEIREDTASAGLLDRSDPALEMPAGRTHSIEFHACHGPTRQVEVMRDSILRLLDQHEHLEEDDILVVCPDLESFAPLIEATLGPTARTGQRVDETDPVPSLRYRLADRSLGASVPLVSAFTALLELVSGRFDAPSVLDFLSLDPVCRRFGFDDDELATITQWVLDVNVRWGLDAESRQPQGVPATVTTNTWQAGIDRIMLGSAVSVPSEAGAGAMLVDTVGAVIPHGVEGSAADVAGRLAEVLWLLAELADDSRTDRPVSEWMELLGGVVAKMFAVGREQQWQLDTVLRTLGETVDSATDQRGGDSVTSRTPLSFNDIRRVVDDRFGTAQGRPSFMRGGVTISSLTPLRWVPHRVIVMLGMDSEALGSGTTDGDDLVAIEPLVGDRDRRGELRQSMLETLLSARDHLLVIRNGNDVRTNQAVPMPVAVAELRDAVVGMVDHEVRDDLLRSIEVDHPRQPFDESYFAETVDSPGDSYRSSARPPRSFDQRSLVAARSRRERVQEARGFLDSPLEVPELEEVTLAELHRFIRNPIRYFVERRLDMRLPRSDDAPSGVLPVSLGGLDAYALGEDLLESLSAAADPGAATAVWRDLAIRTGSVPAGSAGELELTRIELEVLDLVRKATAAGVLPPESASSLQVELPLEDVRVVGVVRTGLDERDGDSGGPAYSRFVRRRPEHRMSMWLDLSVLTAMHPETTWRGVIATRWEAKKSRKVDGVAGVGQVEVTTMRLNADDPAEAARRSIEVVVDLYRRALCEPLPLFRKLSLQAYQKPGADLDWPGSSPYSNPDEAEVLAFGHLSGADLAKLPVLDGDPPGDESDRLSRYARYLFGTLDEATEQVPWEES